MLKYVQLNVLAELTRFADRGFYGDWWNTVSWDQASFSFPRVFDLLIAICSMPRTGTAPSMPFYFDMFTTLPFLLFEFLEALQH